jgi:hypothetical protein
MKSGCEFEELFEGYFRSDLSPAEELALLKHLKSCDSCQVQLDKFYSLHSELSKYNRPKVANDLLDSYYQQVDLSFGRETLSDKLSLILSRFSGKRSPLFRIIQFSSLVIIGLIVGWMIFTPVEPQIVYRTNEPYQISQPISQVDIDFIHTYLVITDMVLLELQNGSDFYLNQAQAQQLLNKTFRASEIALQLNNLRMINFLNRMELLLHEASNLNEEEIEESLVIIRKVINDFDLLREVKDLKSIMSVTKDNFGT